MIKNNVNIVFLTVAVWMLLSFANVRRASADSASIKCGRDCVYLVLQSLGIKSRVDEIDEAFNFRPEVSLLEIATLLESYDLHCEAIRASEEGIRDICIWLLSPGSKKSAILALPTDENLKYHFVYILSGDEDGFTIADTARGGRIQRILFSEVVLPSVPVLLVSKSLNALPTQNSLNATQGVAVIFSVLGSWTLTVGLLLSTSLILLSEIPWRPRVNTFYTSVALLLASLSVATLFWFSIAKNSVTRDGICAVSDTIQLGPVPMGTKQRVSIEVKNSSNHPVAIKSVDGSCSCLSPPRFKKHQLVSNEVSSIEFDIMILKAAENAVQVVIVPESGAEVIVTITYSGISSTRLDPTYFSVGQFPTDGLDVRKIELKIHGYSGEPTKMIANIQSPNPSISVKLIDDILDQDGVLQLLIENRVGYEKAFAERIVIEPETTDPNYELSSNLSFVIVVHGEYSPKLQIEPKLLVLAETAFDGGKSVVRILGSPFRIKGFSESEWFTVVDVSDEDSSESHTLHVRLKDNGHKPQSTVYEHIVVLTDNDLFPEIRIAIAYLMDKS